MMLWVVEDTEDHFSMLETFECSKKGTFEMYMI